MGQVYNSNTPDRAMANRPRRRGSWPWTRARTRPSRAAPAPVWALGCLRRCRLRAWHWKYDRSELLQHWSSAPLRNKAEMGWWRLRCGCRAARRQRQCTTRSARLLAVSTCRCYNPPSHRGKAAATGSSSSSRIAFISDQGNKASNI